VKVKFILLINAPNVNNATYYYYTLSNYQNV